MGEFLDTDSLYTDGSMYAYLVVFYPACDEDALFTTLGIDGIDVITLGVVVGVLVVVGVVVFVLLFVVITPFFVVVVVVVVVGVFVVVVVGAGVLWLGYALILRVLVCYAY